MKKNIKLFFSAIFISCALFLDYELIYNNLLSVRNPFKIGLTAVTVITIIFTYLLGKIKRTKLHYTKWILVVLFSFFMTLGNSFEKNDSWNLVFGNLTMFIISIVSFIGYFILFKNMFYLLDGYLGKLKDNEKINTKRFGKILIKLDEQPFATSLIILIIFWLIYMIAFYPIILSPDPSFQIKQFFNVPTKYADYVLRPVSDVYMTNHHPVMHTLLLGGFIKLGRVFGSDNLGLFMYSIMQTLVLAATLAYSIKFLKDNEVSEKKRLVVLLIYALVPMFPFYAMSGVKDTLYTSFILLYVMFIFNFVKNKRDDKLTIKEVVLITLNLLLIMLFRNNGLYVVALSFPLLILFSKKNLVKTLLIFICSVGIYLGYSKVILPHYGIASGSVREALSIPFQQTARYVKKHDKDLSENDKKVIDKVLGYDDLASRYKPRISDPVKNEYNKYATSEDLKEYFKVWGNGLLKHPGTYVEATMNNVYGYFYPNDTNWYIYNKYDKRITEDNLVDYHYNKLGPLRSVLAGYGIAFPYIPIIGLLSNIGFSTWLLLIMGAYFIEKKKDKYLLVLMPLYVSLLICVASPVNTYFRYAMPYVFAIPMLLTLFLKIIKGSERDEKK